MMYRQIRIDDRDVDLQRIVWSPSEEEPVRHFQLLTVTYGESCAPYLSLRVIQHLCFNEGKCYPEAVDALIKDRYVDDILSGAYSIESARHLRDQLRQLLNAGGFPLCNWVANNQQLLQDLPSEECLRSSWIRISEDHPVNELGILWNPRSDDFRLISPSIGATQKTKREILSAIASFFDPCRWLAPVTVVAKMLLQDLWRAGLDWDQELPSSMTQRWTNFKKNLSHVPDVTLPRWIQTSPSGQVQLHAFSDDHVSTVLLAAKPKLNPIKSLQPSTRAEPRMTIPRLELRAALLASKLIRTIVDDLCVPPEKCYAWCDAQIVLHWLHSSIPVGNSLIENHISHIQGIYMPSTIWRHVPSQLNPADVASGGVELTTLIHDKSWFEGPCWLRESPSNWPCSSINFASVNVGQIAADANAPPTSADELRAKFSDLYVLLRFLVRLCRWARLRIKRPSTVPVLSPITAKEFNDAFYACVILSKRHHFAPELAKLQTKEGHLSRQSPLKGLHVFVDPMGIMRVGGRLQHSSLSYNARHPPILSSADILAKLVITWAHHRALHGGFRSTYVHVVRRVWIVGSKRQIRAHIHRCVVCTRTQPRPMEQAMAPLPPERVTSVRAFMRTGLDYAGPFHLHAVKGRRSRTTKGYVDVFVCLASKGMHFEAVGDLTTESMQGALLRLCGRRGTPLELWSDNATHFHRADLEMKQALSVINWDRVADSMETEGITWRFTPPAAPHFGGLWKAVVKSFKTHLKRIAEPKNLTYEEFSTLLVNFETVLKCRPLSPLSSDIEDLDALNPRHLLIGGPLGTIPEIPVEATNLDRLTHWKLVKGMRHQFWKRWSSEYLNTLQQRLKWTRQRPNLKVGDLLIVLDSSLIRSNGRWPLGRVTHSHEGSDGLVRAATIKTCTGEYVRPIVKLALLPIVRATAEEDSS